MTEKEYFQLLWQNARLEHSKACKEYRVTGDREKYREACKEYVRERKLYYLRRATLRQESDEGAVIRMINSVKAETTSKDEEKKANGMEEEIA